MTTKRSLSKRVFATIFSVAVVVIAVFTVAGTIFMQNRLADTTRDELADEAEVVAASLNSAPSYITLLRHLGLANTRVTLVNAEGDVLYDTEEDPSDMGNHADRPEIERALATGHGSSERSSDTLDEVMLYEAVRLSDGSVIRLAQRQAGYLAILASLVFPLMGLAVAGAVISLIAARRASASIIAPLHDVDLDHPKHNVANAYAEMVPMLERIESQRQELKRQMRVLADNDRMRREFTANITHELKTPLTAISGYAELIANGMVESEDDQRDFGKRIYREAGRLTSLVNDILTLSNLDEAEHSDEGASATANTLGARELVDLPRALDAIYQRLESVAAKSDVTLKLDCSPAIVEGVPRLIDELAYNLASNAIRYNRPQGMVVLACGMSEVGAAGVPAGEAAGGADAANTSAASGAKADVKTGTKTLAPFIRVSDTGIGIAPEEQEKVFERFYRVDKSRSKARGGTGLGLAIVKHAALFHNATIDLQSELGRGTVITVQFPEQVIPDYS